MREDRCEREKERLLNLIKIGEVAVARKLFGQLRRIWFEKGCGEALKEIEIAFKETGTNSRDAKFQGPFKRNEI